VTIIMYHSVSGAADPYTMSPSAFRRQIECIANTYRVARLSDVRDGSSTRGNSTVVITFDDAFADFCEAALPVLEEFSMPCTLFVPTGCIGGWNTWDDGLPGIARKRIMTVGDLRAVRATGLVDFGSHTVDHPRMSRLSRQQMRRQALMSKRFLEDTFDVPIDMFSYPYGQRDDFSALTAQVLAESGYDVAVTTCWGTRHTAGNLLTLPRVSLTEQDTVPVIRGKIDGYYNWIGIKETLGYAWRSRFGTLHPGGDEDTWTQRARPSRGN
jgi:peptidoglycan/xylan/chitin deacetylase (PgdA/CDA1 family)